MLWWLHRLDIADKHRLLVTVGAAYRSVTLTFSPETMWPELDWVKGAPSIPLALRPADHLFPLQDGEDLYIVKGGEHKWGDPHFTFEIAFGEGEVIQGGPLFPTLDWILSLVWCMVRRLNGFLR